MPNVLLITYMFPPLGGIGTPRALAFARHLPRYNCRLTVLAPTKPALRDMDPELNSLIPADVSVYRAWNPELPVSVRDNIAKYMRPSPHAAELKPTNARRTSLGDMLRSLAQRVLFPDPQVVWLPFAMRKARSIIERDRTEVVIITVPPYSLLELAVDLKRDFPRLQVIADFRDEWLNYYLKEIDRPTDDKIRRARQLEGNLVRASSYVSTVTGTWVKTLQERYPEQPATKFICTPNGYEPGLFPLSPVKNRGAGKMVITYFGTIHDNRIYSPANYLRAVESLPEEIKSQIETRFIGRVLGKAHDLLRQTTAPVKVLGFMPKLDGYRRLAETDFALLIATSSGSHAGKLFDYLGAGKPILGLSPPGGEIDLLLQQTRTGWCVDPWDPDAIRQMILSAFWRFKQQQEIITPDVQAVQQYAWPNIFARFAEITQINPTERVVIRTSGTDATVHSLGVGA